MSLKETLGIPDAASFGTDIDGNVHVVDSFGGAWCADEWDDELDDYSDPELDGSLIDPPTDEADLCPICLRVAKDEQELSQ